MRGSYFLFLLLLSLTANAQVPPTGFIRALIESIAEELPDDYDLSQLEEQLVFFNKHPINLNRTSPDELKNLVFLSPIQVAQLFAHIKSNGKLIDVLELQGIPTFDLETVQNIIPFVTVRESDLVDQVTTQNVTRLGDNDLVVRFGRTLEKQKGFTDLLGSHYLGTEERFLFRYKFHYSNRISAALVFEKDAGEKFFTAKKQFLFDHHSAHIALYNSGRFKKIILGDYTLQFGQGLTLWSGFAFGKASDVASVAKKDVGLKAYGSANEYSFFRGFATTFSLLKTIDITSFYSTRSLDGSLSVAGNGDEVMTTISETGLHRTPTEIEHKKNLNQQVYGIIVQYQLNNLSIGAIAYQTIFNKTFVTGPQVYHTFNFVGKQVTNVGINYNYTFKNSYLFGEVGKSLTGGAAALNGILVSLSPKISMALLHRAYQRNYHNFFSQAIGEGTSTMNESGFYGGINIGLKKAWTVSFYADYFKFPWLKFRIDAPSNGHEMLAQLTYFPTKTFKAVLRYKTELKSQNTDLQVPVSFLDDVKKESYRAEVNWQLNKAIKFQNRIEFSQFRKGTQNAEFGYLAYQDVSYAPLFSKISGNLRLAYFNTASFNSRIYAYEDDVLYNFGFGMYSGKGYRTILNLKYKVFKQLDVWIRHTIFLYPLVETVGSGLDEIMGNKKTDVKLQIRYQF